MKKTLLLLTSSALFFCVASPAFATGRMRQFPRVWGGRHDARRLDQHRLWHPFGIVARSPRSQFQSSGSPLTADQHSTTLVCLVLLGARGCRIASASRTNKRRGFSDRRVLSPTFPQYV